MYGKPDKRSWRPREDDPVKVVRGPLLADRTTLKLGGKAIAEIVVRETPDLDDLAGVLVEQTAKHGGRPLVLGEGSNILAAERDMDLVLVRLEGGGDPEIMERGDDGNRISRTDREAVRIRVPGALRLPKLLGWCTARGLSGLEPWAGIPGSVGGAVAMNAGSYGLEVAQVLERVLIWTPDRGGRWLDAAALQFGYRRFDSGLGDVVQLVLAAELRVERCEPDEVRSRMRDWYGRKKQSQPISMASAGCVFKNPAPENPAGRLLEQVGLRGFRRGDMGFSERHANFLINFGGGSADDAFALLDLARERVAFRFGLELETEVKVLE
ncbi:UDP-N-acetylmuramate dehydrogenase [Desulfonatronum sp. SC1]|uniref:UDP-N-acetylmuramate dehydrogenase n=1 Tax=Desulfonatronum sp. SC1 TaxID=2109626 RepID=UPI000D31E85F|nr:UDP-N-acetylmuramate dehydrogenase [Desulfonatronum sp. SC1]PTN33072.1 UDP-N-acetylenolpyruvoylglucosamine reductase [Desulfonatronum sp. SC1]